jgi:hypothetical protein
MNVNSLKREIEILSHALQVNREADNTQNLQLTDDEKAAVLTAYRVIHNHERHNLEYTEQETQLITAGNMAIATAQNRPRVYVPIH